MRKIPSSVENPIDNVLIHFVDLLTPFFIKIKITPNMLTSLGVIFRILSIYFLVNDNPTSFFIFGTLSYVLDCADGHLARSSNNCTNFGDQYDHFSDLIYHLILIYLVLFGSNTMSQFGGTTKIIILLVILIMFYCSLMHLGCQQKWYTEGSTEGRTRRNEVNADEVGVNRRNERSEDEVNADQVGINRMNERSEGEKCIDENKESTHLNHLKVLCPNKSHIYFTRFIGCGTVFLVVYLFIAMYYKK